MNLWFEICELRMGRSRRLCSLFNRKSQIAKRRSKAGFTLMEVMLASLILAIGLGMIMAAVSQCLSVARSAKIFDTTRDLLARVEADNPIEIVEDIEDIADDGKFDDPTLEKYAWRREVEPVGDKKFGLFMITTTVTWSENNKESQEQLVTYRYSAKEAAKAVK